MGDPVDPKDKLREVAQSLSIPLARRHIFLCADQTKPKCAEREVTVESWDYLKRRLEELGIAKGENCVFRTKANCLAFVNRVQSRSSIRKESGITPLHLKFWSEEFRSI